MAVVISRPSGLTIHVSFSACPPVHHPGPAKSGCVTFETAEQLVAQALMQFCPSNLLDTDVIRRITEFAQGNFVMLLADDDPAHLFDRYEIICELCDNHPDALGGQCLVVRSQSRGTTDAKATLPVLPE